MLWRPVGLLGLKVDCEGPRCSLRMPGYSEAPTPSAVVPCLSSALVLPSCLGLSWPTHWPCDFQLSVHRPSVWCRWLPAWQTSLFPFQEQPTPCHLWTTVGLLPRHRWGRACCGPCRMRAECCSLSLHSGGSLCSHTGDLL